MSVEITQPEINVRKKLIENKQRYGIKGKQILESETTEDVRSIIGADRKNLVINGGFDIWQRGTFFNSHVGFSADRFFSWHNAKIERTDLVGSQFSSSYGLKITKDTVGISHPYALVTDVENFRQFINKSWTISFWTRSNKIADTGTIIMRVENNSGSLGDFNASFRSLPEPHATTEWVKKTTTLNVSDYDISEISQTASLRLYLLSALNTGTNPLELNDWIEIAEVQLELGDGATKFEHRPVSQELALCQRYYQKSYNLDDAPGTITSNGAIVENSVRNNANDTVGAKFKTRMRTVPTVTLYNDSTGTPGTANNISPVAAVPTNIGETGWSNTNLTGATTDTVAFQYTADAEL